MAKMIGKSGRVIAVDLQQGMLENLNDKIRGTEFEERIILHKSDENKIDVTDNIDFALAFYVLHELSDQGNFLRK